MKTFVAPLLLKGFVTMYSLLVRHREYKCSSFFLDSAIIISNTAPEERQYILYLAQKMQRQCTSVGKLVSNLKRRVSIVPWINREKAASKQLVNCC